MDNKHEDLKQAAIEAVAAYMHHHLVDAGFPAVMLSFLKDQSTLLVTAADNAITATIERGKKEGLIK